MKPFDLEEARKGAQIVHLSGDKAKDWHYFNGRQDPVYVQWEDNLIVGYSEDDPAIGLVIDRVEEYVPFTTDGFHTGYPTLKMAQEDYPDAITFYKVSAEEDGGNWSMERVT
jgi:hypothetical protein